MHDGGVGVQANRFLTVRRALPQPGRDPEATGPGWSGPARSRAPARRRVRKWSSASSAWPSSRSPMPRLLWATTKSGRKLKARRRVFDRLGVLTQSLQGRTEVAERFGIVGPDRQCRPATASGAIEIASAR